MKKSEKIKNLNSSINFLNNNQLMKIYNSIVKDSKDIDKVIEAIVAIDSYLLAMDTLLNIENLEKEYSEIVEFVNWFNEKYENNEVFIKKMQEEFGKTIPKLYTLYNFIKTEEKRMAVQKMYDELNSLEKQNADILFDYMFNCNNTKQIIFISDFGSDKTEFGMFEVTSENNSVYKDTLREYAIILMKYGGNLIFRYIKDENVISNGFIIQDGRVLFLDVETLKVFLNSNKEIMNVYNTEQFKNKKLVFEVPKCKFVK